LKNENFTWQNFEIITTYSKKGLKVNLEEKQVKGEYLNLFLSGMTDTRKKNCHSNYETI